MVAHTGAVTEAGVLDTSHREYDYILWFEFADQQFGNRPRHEPHLVPVVFIGVNSHPETRQVVCLFEFERQCLLDESDDGLRRTVVEADKALEHDRIIRAHGLMGILEPDDGGVIAGKEIQDVEPIGLEVLASSTMMVSNIHDSGIRAAIT